MSNVCRGIASLVGCYLFVAAVVAADPVKPGPEHQRLKDLEGTWDAAIKLDGGEQ